MVSNQHFSLYQSLIVSIFKTFLINKISFSKLRFSTLNLPWLHLQHFLSSTELTHQPLYIMILNNFQHLRWGLLWAYTLSSKGPCPSSLSLKCLLASKHFTMSQYLRNFQCSLRMSLLSTSAQPTLQSVKHCTETSWPHQKTACPICKEH